MCMFMCVCVCLCVYVYVYVVAFTARGERKVPGLKGGLVDVRLPGVDVRLPGGGLPVKEQRALRPPGPAAP